MDKNESLKKEHRCAETDKLCCNKTQAILDCEAILGCKATCRDILKYIHEPVAAPKVKKERPLLDQMTEYIILWN
jgi:hypothetical protein